MRDIFQLRSRVVSAIRRFLDGRGFIEVETPVLQPTAGGAAARPFVTHHNTLDRDLYLRIATELHLKRLVVGGFDKVYEIGRVFRNEGISTKHNPEFTMLESYEAYADYQDVMRMVEEMVAHVGRGRSLGHLQLTYGDHEIDLTPPWRRLTLRAGADPEHSGIDFEAHPDIESLRRAMAELGVEPEPGAGWGKLIDELVSTFVEPKLIQPTFLIDYPVELSPLAKRKPDDPNATSSASRPSLAGLEIANAYSELNDPLEQRQRFVEQARLRAAGDEEAEMVDEDFSWPWSTACRPPAASASASTAWSCSSPASAPSARSSSSPAPEQGIADGRFHRSNLSDSPTCGTGSHGTGISDASAPSDPRCGKPTAARAGPAVTLAPSGPSSSTWTASSGTASPSTTRRST